MADHEEWTPWSIWHGAQLPDQAFERLAAGGVWRIQEPIDPRDQVVARNNPEAAFNRSYRIAVYKLGRARSYGSATVLGMWEGDKDWVEVGWIEGG